MIASALPGASSGIYVQSSFAQCRSDISYACHVYLTLQWNCSNAVSVSTEPPMWRKFPLVQED